MPEPAYALVTGGASGLGAAAARMLAQHGYGVIVFDREEASGAQVAHEIGGAFVHGDVTAPDDVAAAVGNGRPLRVVVNAAGVAHSERILSRDRSHDLEAFERVVRINLVGTFDVLRQAAATMAGNDPGEDGERGVIVNTASIGAFEPTVGLSAYSAAKGGVVSLTLAAARDLARTGIRVVTIAPGLFSTPMVAAVSDAAMGALTAEAQFPARTGQPDEYAALVLHVVENRMLNGTTIRLDGAVRMPGERS